jgi:hypothetical protein
MQGTGIRAGIAGRIHVWLGVACQRLTVHLVVLPTAMHQTGRMQKEVSCHAWCSHLIGFAELCRIAQQPRHRHVKE